MADERKGAILLVDDDVFLLEMYATKFRLASFDVHMAKSTEDALKTIRDGLAPRAIVFDILMPGGDGFYLLQRLRQERLGEGALKVALTNESKEDERDRAKELGADLYLIKASTIPSEVVHAVSEALDERATAR